MNTQNNRKIHLLLVDDDRFIRLSLKNLLSDFAIVSEAASEKEARILLSSNTFDMAILDLEMESKRSGINLLKETVEQGIYSILLSGSQSLELTEEAYNQGCSDFIDKRNYKDYIRSSVQKYININLTNDLDYFFKEIYVTQDEKLKKDLMTLFSTNYSSTNVLITGSTGVGKTLISKKLHELSQPSAPFIHLNCSEFAESLLESELFGHAKGAFTGATSNKKGKLELANNGFLFLDEVATMSMSMQKKLLKVLDDNSFTPVGSQKEITSKFKLICATCESLEKKIKRKEFREDLYYRINGMRINLPDLKDRNGDIKYLIQSISQKQSRRIILKPCALEKMINYPWPGNIRELKNALVNLSLNTKGIIYEKDIDLSTNKERNSTLSFEQTNYIKHNGLRNFIAQIESESLNASLKRHSGKITASIKELKISSSAFYRIQESSI